MGRVSAVGDCRRSYCTSILRVMACSDPNLIGSVPLDKNSLRDQQPRQEPAQSVCWYSAHYNSPDGDQSRYKKTFLYRRTVSMQSDGLPCGGLVFRRQAVVNVRLEQILIAGKPSLHESRCPHPYQTPCQNQSKRQTQTTDGGQCGWQDPHY